MSMWTVYWLTRLDGIVSACEGIQVVAFIAFVIAGAFYTFAIMTGEDNGYEQDKIASITSFLKQAMFSLFVSFVIASAVRMFTPTQKEMAAIYLLPKIVNNEQVRELPSNVLTLMNKKLEEWIDDLGEK